jgi:membrane-bound serine protease (ClpP class)
MKLTFERIRIMKLKQILLIVITVLCMLGILSPSVSASGNEVILAEVTGEVNAAMTAYIKSEIAAAEKEDSPLILVLDTYGGEILEADNIKQAILDSKVSVDCYITRNALSAGTLISISCRHIVMAPSAVMGAAETIPNDEKVLSTWVGILTSAAEARGRDTQIVAAMADKDISIEGVTEAGSLLTLGATDAERLGISDGIAADEDEALSLLGYSGYTAVQHGMSSTVKAAQFLTSTGVVSILFIAGIICMFIEIFTPGFGVFGVLSIICFGLYFGGGILAGFAEWWSIALFILGIGFMVVEAVIPGFGIFGILGIASLVAGLIFTSRDLNTFLTVLGVGIVGSAVLLPFVYLLLKKLGLLRRVISVKDMLPEEGYVSHDHIPSLVGKKGVAITVLRPAGAAKIKGVRYSVVSTGGYIPQGAKIKVIEHTPGRIVVDEDEKK